jgi:hypothetical protein
MEKNLLGPGMFLFAIQLTVDGKYILAGGCGDFYYDTGSVSVIKVDINGALEWAKACKGDLNCEGMSIYQTSDGGYIVGG